MVRAWCHANARSRASCFCVETLGSVHAVLQTLADCRLGQQYLGGNATTCSFDAKDLSWINIRLGN